MGVVEGGIRKREGRGAEYVRGPANHSGEREGCEQVDDAPPTPPEIAEPALRNDCTDVHTGLESLTGETRTGPDRSSLARCMAVS